MGIKMNSEDNKVYVILGAPHSATSFLTKILDENGIDMGRFGLVSGKPYYFEDEAFKGMNKKILQKAGGDLRNPPDEEEILEVDVDKEIKDLVRKRSKKFWGWKDPRTTLTIKKYLPHLKDDTYLICVFRDPDRLVDSFKNKSGFGKEFTKEILDKYNKSIISAIKEFCKL